MPESAALTPVLNPAFLYCKPGVTKADEDKLKEALHPTLEWQGGVLFMESNPDLAGL